MIWIAGLTFVVLVVQAIVFWKQLAVMGQQKGILGGQLDLQRGQLALQRAQIELQQQQAEWRRVAATGAFSEVAFALAKEFQKADVICTGLPVDADHGMRARAVLHDAGNVFAPLGSGVVAVLSSMGRELDSYFEAVTQHNRRVADKMRPIPVAESNRIDHARECIGLMLDRANACLAENERYGDPGQPQYFRRLCSRPRTAGLDLPG